VEGDSGIAHRVVDRTELFDGQSKPLQPYNLTHEIVHRLSLTRETIANPNPVLDCNLTSEDIVVRFGNTLMGTGGRTPYHIHIFGDGRIEQVLPLTIRGAHANGYNWRSVAVALIGNTDERACSLAQYDALIWVSRALRGLNKGLAVEGHTYLPGASNDPYKRCPGLYLDMNKVRAAVSDCPVVTGDVWKGAEMVGFVV